MKNNIILILTLLFFCQDVYSASFQENYKLILKIINGDPVDVLSTPHFCNDPAPITNRFKEEIEWRINGIGTCKNIYTPKM